MCLLPTITFFRENTALIKCVKLSLKKYLRNRLVIDALDITATGFYKSHASKAILKFCTANKLLQQLAYLFGRKAITTKSETINKINKDVYYNVAGKLRTDLPVIENFQMIQNKRSAC